MLEPVRKLTEDIIDVPSRISVGVGVDQAEVDGVDHRRGQVINLFKADINSRLNSGHGQTDDWEAFKR